MNFLQSLLYDAMGAAIVIAVLFALALIIRLFVLASHKRANHSEEQAEPAQQALEAAEAEPAQYAQGGLKLFDVDGKTAALIMAIVSHESGIHLSELQFRSIRLVKS